MTENKIIREKSIHFFRKRERERDKKIFVLDIFIMFALLRELNHSQKERSFMYVLEAKNIHSHPEE